MARKKKTFSAVTAVKKAARKQVGTPAATRVEPASRPKKEKHKPTLAKLLEER